MGRGRSMPAPASNRTTATGAAATAAQHRKTLAQHRRLLHDESLPLPDRIAGLLVCSTPRTSPDIESMTTAAVDDDGTTSGSHSPPADRASRPLAGLMREHLAPAAATPPSGSPPTCPGCSPAAAQAIPSTPGTSASGSKPSGCTRAPTAPQHCSNGRRTARCHPRPTLRISIAPRQLAENRLRRLDDLRRRYQPTHPGSGSAATVVQAPAQHAASTPRLRPTQARSPSARALCAWSSWPRSLLLTQSIRTPCINQDAEAQELATREAAT